MKVNTKKINTKGGTKAFNNVNQLIGFTSVCAGNHCGLVMATTAIKSANNTVNNKLGYIAPKYISPTGTLSVSAKTINTKDGGIICASVPDAIITPLLIAGE